MIFRLIPTKYDAENGKSRKCTDTIVENKQISEKISPIIYLNKRQYVKNETFINCMLL